MLRTVSSGAFFRFFASFDSVPGVVGSALWGTQWTVRRQQYSNSSRWPSWRMVGLEIFLLTSKTVRNIQVLPAKKKFASKIFLRLTKKFLRPPRRQPVVLAEEMEFVGETQCAG